MEQIALNGARNDKHGDNMYAFGMMWMTVSFLTLKQIQSRLFIVIDKASVSTGSA